MSYMSGMMLGLAFGQSVRRFLTGGAAKPETPAFFPASTWTFWNSTP